MTAESRQANSSSDKGETGPMKTRIKFPSQHKPRRAVRRASRAGFGAACIWCGHAYHLGEYTSKAEDAHLLQCPGFPEERKQQIRECQQRERARRTHTR